MDVTFPTADAARLCSSMKLLQRRWGVVAAPQIAQRLAELAAVDDLPDVQMLLGSKFRWLDGRRRSRASLGCDCGVDLVVRALPANAGSPLAGVARVERVLVVSVGGERLRPRGSRR